MQLLEIDARNSKVKITATRIIINQKQTKDLEARKIVILLPEKTNVTKIS